MERMEEKPPLQRIAVIGAGAWGTALAAAAARAGRDVTLWARERETAEAIAATGENPLYLPGRPIPPQIRATTDMGAALADAEAAALVVPSQHLRAMAEAFAKAAARDLPAVICAKGVEAETGLLMTEVAAQAAPGRPLAALSGPSFAEEVAAGLPTAVTVASDDMDLAAWIAQGLMSPSFRPYVSDDVTGVEIGGAAKNVIAIACGVASGLGFRSNTRAALITRGLAEMQALAAAMGARAETLSGLSGLGDLTLTCSSEQSRNFSFGKALGEGGDPAELLARGRAVVEGAANAVSVTDLARRHGVEMPICEAVRSVIERRAPIDETIAALMARPLKVEPRGAVAGSAEDRRA